MKSALDVRRLLRHSKYCSLIIIAITIAAFRLMAATTDSRGVLDAIGRIDLLTTISVMTMASYNYAWRCARPKYLQRHG